MESPMLSAPQTGHSRFSKALPVPPAFPPSALEDSDDTSSTASTIRGLPPLPPAPFPPRKDSVLRPRSYSISSIKSIKRKPLASSIPEVPPALPPKMETRSIPRRPLGSTRSPPADGEAKSQNTKRVPSVSSILSAYSHTSADSATRTSQDYSEPTSSPEREESNGKAQPARGFEAYSGNPYADEVLPPRNEATGEETGPPPIPLKDNKRSISPRKSPAGSSQTETADSSAVSGSPGSSPKREIWRRRASSKSERSLAMAGLNIPNSRGFTAATSQAELPLPALPAHASTTAPLPPQGGPLPGRNIRPTALPDRPSKESVSGDATAKANAIPPRRPLDTSFRALQDKFSSDNLAASPKLSPTSRTPIQQQQPGLPPRHPRPALSAISLRSAAAAAAGEVQGSRPSTATTPTEAAAAIMGQSASALTKQRNPSDTPPMHQHPALRPSASADLLSRSSSSSQNNTPPPPPPAAAVWPLPTQKAVVAVEPSPQVSPRAPPPPPEEAMPRSQPSSGSSNSSNSSSSGSSPSPRSEEEPHLSAAAAEAVARFRRTVVPGQTGEDGVWPAPRLGRRHFACYARHEHFVAAKNVHYALACQACGAADKRARRTCAWCNLRVCVPCFEALVAGGRDLEALVRGVKERAAKEKEAEAEAEAEAEGKTDDGE
ncbi:hypothetical protein F4780DRAFT_554711 [Xylariomycetidae sp. FL0641]|nr:hypothetical protein F4780DRAFT_554711 [Xylariomycetidae sp. FL0641]